MMMMVDFDKNSVQRRQYKATKGVVFSSKRRDNPSELTPLGEPEAVSTIGKIGHMSNTYQEGL
jgi:hypothetical protein